MKTSLLASTLLATSLVLAPTVNAAEDEWYDPTDWFDGNNLEHDDTLNVGTYDAYDYDYDYGFDDAYDYGYDWTSYDNTWGVNDWDDDYYDADYWGDYDWYDTYDTIDGDIDDTYTYIIYPRSYSDSSSAQNSTAQSDRSQKGQKSKVAKLNGTVQGLSKMKLKRPSGAIGTYTIAKVALENGKTTIVNLGRESQLQDVQLKKGDKIQALGRRGQVANETVFVAHKLKANGSTIDANPTIRLTQSNQGQSTSGNNPDAQAQQNRDSAQQTIQGTVASVTKAAADASSKQQHTLINLRLENGQSTIVDLGPAASLEKIDLQAGEQVTVRGTQRNMNGRQVLVPDLMRVEGESISAVTE